MKDKELLKQTLTKILTEIAYLMTQNKKSVEDAFIIMRTRLVNMGEFSENTAANLIRIALGIYMSNEKYVDGAFNSIKKELEC